MKKSLIVICGPTAIGKTSMAINIAREFHAEIISADSRQFYKELKIGVAAPSKEELAMASHHFVGHLSVTDYYNVSSYENDVLNFLRNYFTKNDYAVMVGGSGLYIDAVCFGIDDLPDPDEDIRNKLKAQLQENGIASLQKQLKKLDPAYSDIVDLNNPNRLLRALEVCLMTGQTFTDLRKKSKKEREFNIIKIGLTKPRHELNEIIHQRVGQMIENGLLQEVEGLLKFRDLNALNTVGYKEMFKYLDGDWSMELAIEKIKTHTRRYAKRQMTWFNRDKDIRWFLPDELTNIFDYILKKN
ncbi:MAG: tRNA (adenosine(37)-N6)-dimethylallyltransferase MiaA [Bacteroidales bacterium]|nr:tRNA (adenosine(37)-N6)-dimethylallyltransferase MiaA [Bacteroidales bacterium]MCF8402790.1 tRNA (adenosine(37)-N6)-dimethylallyltransferase MiaA [Bacteroidales bacterium]